MGLDQETTLIAYVYDNEDVILEYLTKEDDEHEDEHQDKKGDSYHGKDHENDHDDNIDTTRYLHGPGIDEPLMMEQKGKAYYYHADGLGSIVALTDDRQKSAQTYDYSSFGDLNHQRNNLKQPYTYTGREWDEEIDLFYYRARYYDAQVGRFSSIDPLSHPNFNLKQAELFTNKATYPSFDSLLVKPQNLGPFTYVINNPINQKDPLGLFWWFDCARSVASRESSFPEGTSDKYTHCVVLCKIYAECGLLDAVMAGIGKEFLDIFTPHDASLADLAADYRGVQCGKSLSMDECCSCESCCKSRSPK